MTTESGQQVGIAFEAVRQCHQDVGRLIADFDGYMTKDKWKRIWNQDAVTWGISRAAYAPYWMAKILYRLYVNQDVSPDVVDGINIRFFSDDKTLSEPRIVVGRAKYSIPLNKSLGKVTQTWDFDEGYSKWCNPAPDDYGKILSCINEKRGVSKMNVVAMHLYSITSLDQVTTQLEEIRRRFEVGNE